MKLKNLSHQSAQLLVNEKIPYSQILLIEESQKTILSKQEALQKAQSQGLDLVCLRPEATPPVCKIINYQKLHFDLNKKAKVQKKGSKKTITKEIKINFHTEEGDLITKLNHIKKWLENGFLVKVNLKMFGQEQRHQDLAWEKCQKIIHDLQAQSTKTSQQGEIKLQGNTYSFFLYQSK